MRSFLSPYGGWYKSGMNGLETRTCFRPLTGMVLSNGADFFCAILFSPPYGDGTYDREWSEEEIPFSPPYGDGTNTPVTFFLVYEFSPPYGDGTIVNCTPHTINLFSPPYGDGTE